ncbi:g5684 [Coccomyxa elongata]
MASSPSRGWLAVASDRFISLHSCDSSGTPTRRLMPNSGSCTALCFSHDSETLLSVSSAALGFWGVHTGEQTAQTVLDGEFPEPRELENGASQHRVPVTVSRHCSEDLFAVGIDKKLIVLNSDGNVTCKFGPLESSICGLEWGPHGHLYIDLGTKLLTTSCDENQPLLPLHAEPTTALSVSTKASFLALGVASPTLGFQVHVWGLSSEVNSKSQCKEGSSNSNTLMKGVVTLNDYDSEVTCMAWNEKERYLATSDGAEATIWDIADAQAGQSVMSVVCCGHSAKTKIEHMAFQPDGAFLATAGSDGRILLFDSSLFAAGAGGILSPAAAQQITSTGSPIVGLEWLSGGKLVAATANGHVTALQLGASELAAEDAQPETVPVERCTSQPQPPATSTTLTQQQEATPQNSGGNDGVPTKSGSPALPRPVLLTDEFEDTSAAANKVEELVPNGPKLEIKTDTKAAAATLNGPNGVPVTERSLSCNLSPLTPKFTPGVPCFTNKDSKDSNSLISETEIALHDSTSSLSPQGSVDAEATSGSAKPPVVLTQPRPSTSPAGQGAPSIRPGKLRVETFASQQSPRAPAGRTSENGGMSGPRRTYSQDSYPRVTMYSQQQRQGSNGLPQLDRSSSLNKVPPRNGGQMDAPPRTNPLSPGLLQHIQAVKENPQPPHSSHRSDLAGWGPGPLPPMPASPSHHHVQYMVPYGQQMGGGQMAPMFMHAPGPPPFGYYPVMSHPGMGPQPLLHTMPPPGVPSSPAHSQPGTPSGRMRGPAPPPMPPPQSPMRGGVPSVTLEYPGPRSGVPSGSLEYPAPRPVPAGPMMFVPAGAQPPQGWAPVMVPPPGWVGMYGQPPFMHPAPHMPPPQEVGEDTFDQAPPFITPFPEDSVGISSNPQVRWAAGYRSAPANLSREQLMGGGGYYSKQPAFGGVPRPAPPPDNTAPVSFAKKAEGVGSNSISEEGSTGDNCSDTGDKPPKAASGNSSIGCASPSFARGMAKPTFSAGGLLMSEAVSGEAPHPITTLYVGNLAPTVDEYVLMTTFQFFGQITNIQVIRDKNSAQSRGFAFVTFAHPQAATNAQSYMNGMTLYGAFGGRSVRVGPSNRASSLLEE